MYAHRQEIRQLLRETFFPEIYIDAVAGPANSIIFKLPGGLKEKLKGDFFQIFWNPAMSSCSSTHWDDNDSLLCILQKTVEMAPHDAIVETWGDDAQVKGRCGYLS